MFDADASLAPLIAEDDDALSPWDDAVDVPVPVEPDEEEDSIVPKPVAPLDEDEEEDDDIGLLSDELDEEL
ncbi:MAG: hypothetical protein NUW02_01150 [Candidatus Campbellbacteria bacterium]|nr:hypothetical protein [Candidatus Campbellbacteria bacterium]